MEAKASNLSAILYQPADAQPASRAAVYCVRTTGSTRRSTNADRAARGAIEKRTPIRIELPIRNIHRHVGAHAFRRNRRR